MNHLLLCILLFGNLSSTPTDLFRCEIYKQYPCLTETDWFILLVNTKEKYRTKAWKRDIREQHLSRKIEKLIYRSGKETGFFTEYENKEKTRKRDKVDKDDVRNGNCYISD